jgi:oxygen-independent coproporphyrinogen-3 oxidase
MNDKSQKPILSMYIHIPFCERKCAYCDFLSFDCKNDKIEAYLEALHRQIESSEYKDSWMVGTLFFGGGTPSILNSNQISRLMTCIKSNFTLSDDAEITMECNPGTLNKNKIKAIKESGINRISLGVQSTDVVFLERLGRIHDDKTVYEQYQLLRDNGFGNINLDFMYGLPEQTLKEWEKQIDTIIELAPEHISAYGLIVEKDTAYEKLYEEQPEIFPDEDLERDMYWLTHDKLTNAGYVHYEISNYCKPGLASRHNETYWLLRPYIGLGLGSASYIDKTRFSITKDLELFIDTSINPSLLIDQETIINMDKRTVMEEYMFLGLRRLEGIDMRDFEIKFNQSFMDTYGEITTKFVKDELMVMTDRQLYLTPRGIDISNYVMSHFLFDK